MKINKMVSSAIVAAMILTVAPTASMALGGATGPAIDYEVKGQIGHVKMDPYGYAPLTAVITNGGYDLADATVTIVPKKDGQVIKYKVSNVNLKQHGGIPVFGLYANFKNTVEVEYTKTFNNKTEKLKETYSIFAPPYFQTGTGAAGQAGIPFASVSIKTVDKEFADRLYLVNNIPGKSGGKSSQMVWNNPSGGSLEWNYFSNAFIVDTKGEVRWYINADKLMNHSDIYQTGIMMGFKQNDDGALSWGYGQRYVKYDAMGREVFNRQIPLAYNDVSHSVDNMKNGHFLLRVGSSNMKRLDGKNVRTVRDVIAEVDANGNVVDDWKLYDILDPYRDIVFKALDQGAVCLNVDASHAGQTVTAEDLAKLDTSDKFGDIVGSGPGRNWAHVNSVDHDPADDSIVISSRHQSAVIKIGRDKQVKWIIGAHKGWKKEFQNKLLQPIDSKGNKIICDDEYSKCPGYADDKGGFDWTWTQHTAFVIDSKTNKDIAYISVFDNGDARGIEQPAIPSMKYSRAVIYKVDQKKMTVQQVWEYGKERGIEWFSPITSLVEYAADKDSVMVYSATAGMQYDLTKGKAIGAPEPEIDEFKWNSTTPSVQMRFKGAGSGYQAMPFSVEKAFSK